LCTYVKNYFNPDYLLNIQYYQTNELVEALKSGKSLIRIGDGEIYIMNGGSISYQKFYPGLQKSLLSIVNDYSDDSPYLLGLNKIPISKSNAQLKKDNLITCWLPMKVYWNLYFNKNAHYFDATAFYYNETIPKYFEEYFKTKQLILVTREGTITSLKNNKLFPFTAIEYILTPDENTYEQYGTILEEILAAVDRHVTSNVIVLLACGPASKALALTLTKKNIVSIDVGRGIEVAYTEERIDHIIYPGM
jgi:hypothetical protein